MRSSLMLTLALVLALAGCGQGRDESAAIRSLTDRVGTGANFDSVRIFGPDFPACFAERLVESAGLEQLVEDGVLTKDQEAAASFGGGTISEATATAYVTAEYDCIDWTDVATYLQDSGDLLPATKPQIEEYVACLAAIEPADWQAGRKDQTLGQDTSAAITTFETATGACRETAGL